MFLIFVLKIFIARRFYNVVRIYFVRLIFVTPCTYESILMVKIFLSTATMHNRVSETTRSNLSTSKFENFPGGALLPPPSVDTDVIHVINDTRPSPSVLAYCKQ